MADVLLSYASADRVKAGTLASLLLSAGWSVWWDRDAEGGEEWGQRIEKELCAARCVVVLWTRRSISSEWVIHEARAARVRGTMLPVLLEPVKPPEELAEVHATTLTAWRGQERSFELHPFLNRLATILGSTPPEVDEAPLVTTITKLSRVEVVEAAFAFCAARLEFFRLRESRAGAPQEVLDQMGRTYDSLCEILAPVSSEDIHNLIAVNEDAFTPQGPWNPP
jgi:hypothetical protein